MTYSQGVVPPALSSWAGVGAVQTWTTVLKHCHTAMAVEHTDCSQGLMVQGTGEELVKKQEPAGTRAKSTCLPRTRPCVQSPALQNNNHHNNKNTGETMVGLEIKLMWQIWVPRGQ